MRAVDEVIAALASHSGDTYSFLVGSPPFDPPPELGIALAAAAKGDFDYGPPAGLPELRRLLADHCSTEDASVAPEEIVVTHGAKGGLLVALADLVEPGDRVIHPEPCYPAYPTMARHLGAEPIGVPETDGDFYTWVDAVASRIDGRTRAVILSSPSNPSGSTLSMDAAECLIDVCRSREIALLLDEAYVHFRTDKAPADNGAWDPDLSALIRLRSGSKSWAIPGWRIGWIVASSKRAQRLAGLQASLLNPPNTPIQHALLALSKVEPGYLDTARREVRFRLESMAQALSQAGLFVRPPAGGFYLWIDLRPYLEMFGTRTSREWCRVMAAERGVGLWPGEDFSAPGFARLAARGGGEWESTCAEVAGRLVSGLSATIFKNSKIL